MSQQRILPTIFTLLSIFLLAASSEAGPVFQRSVTQQQEVLKSDGLIVPSKQQKLHSSKFLDAMPDSVGVLVMTPGGEEEEEVVHLWLPIGERVYTRTQPRYHNRPPEPRR